MIEKLMGRDKVYCKAVADKVNEIIDILNNSTMDKEETKDEDMQKMQ